MVMFGHLRPKPDQRMFRALMARLRFSPAHAVLVEDTLEHQRAAHAVGLRTVWMQGFAPPSASGVEPRRERLLRRPVYVGQRVRHLRQIRSR
jgi:putative hydrolase of the HAD superfamily